MASFHYHLGTHTKEQYDALDASLRDPDDPTYVAREVEQTDDILHSPTRGIFWLSEEEVAELSTKPEINFIHKDPDSYPEDYPQPSEDDLNCLIEETYRYNEPVKHNNRFASASDYPTSPDVTDLRRCGYQLLRTTSENGVKAKRDIWASDTTVSSANIKKTGTGLDVDVVCMDNGTWIGHIEFINNRPAGESPTDYIGGNVLPGNGICDCLDLVLDGPYYIDPDWFNAAPGSRLTTRWDGTTVPVESEARNWWGSTSNRSSSFASYGTVVVSSTYTRLRANGDFNTDTYSGTHGTQCASQIFGRTHGWAYNSNKWIIDGYSGYGLGLTKVWDVQKIFHQAKPVNSKYGTKDPTISSNSWGYRAQPPTTGYATHRGTQYSYSNRTSDGPRFMRYVGLYGDGYRMKSEFVDQSITTSAKEMIDAGVIFVCASGNSNQKQVKYNHPDYDNFYHTSSSGTITDGATFTQFGYAVYPTTNRPGFPQHAGKYPGTTATYNINAQNSGSSAYVLTGNDRVGSVSGSNASVSINVGDTVNFSVNASGHPFWVKNSAVTGTGDAATGVTNNGSQNGTVSFVPTTTGTFYYICQYHGGMVGTITVSAREVIRPTINVGALDDQYASSTKERKVNYSDMGNEIDLYAPADGSLAATVGTYGTDIPRYDDSYVSKSGNTTWSDGQTGSPSTSRDTRFSGTSAACPVAAGLIATIVQYNRSWTWSDIRNWLGTLQTQNTTSDFYDGVEDAGANDTGHSDVNKLHGSIARVIYQGGTFTHTTKETTTKDLSFGSGVSISGTLGMSRD